MVSSIGRIIVGWLFDDPSSNLKIVGRDVHHSDDLVCIVGKQKRLKSFVDIDVPRPATDKARWSTAFRVHLIAEPFIVRLLALLEGVPPLVSDERARVLQFLLFV